MAMSGALIRQELESHLLKGLHASAVKVESIEKLGGGAIQENWAIDVHVRSGPHDGHQQWVLRTDSPSSLEVSHNKRQEYALLKTAFDVGVLVPEPICFLQSALSKHAFEQPAGASATGNRRSCYVMQRMPGEARGNRLVKSPDVLRHGDEIVAELARQLARIHSIVPPHRELSFIERPATTPAQARIEELHRSLLRHGEPQPVVELSLHWLASNMPTQTKVALCHGDLRTGNFLIHEGRLSAILDWEFACFSDPLDDLGWMLARCWRFGNYRMEAGGLGRGEAFVSAYEHATGTLIDRRVLAYWQLMATVRWATIALDQAARAYDQGEPSLELALTREVLPSLEWDMLDMLEWFEREPN